MGHAYRGIITAIDVDAVTVNAQIPYLSTVGDYGPMAAYFDITSVALGDGVWVTSADENSSEDFAAVGVIGGWSSGGGGGGVPTSRQIIAGTGLTGGGDLTADRTLAVDYSAVGTALASTFDAHGSAAGVQTNLTTLSASLGTAAFTASSAYDAAGSAAAITLSGLGGVPTTRTVTAGTGLTGGGDLSANRTFTVSYGTSSTTACVGNDTRLSDTRTPTASSIFDSMVNASAAIAFSKIAAPSADFSMNSHKITNGTDPVSAQDFATKNYVDTGAYGTWTSIASLGTNTSLGTPPLQTRTTPGGKVEFRGQLAFTGAITSGATIATVPSPLPYAAIQYSLRWAGTGSANLFLNIDVSGHLSVNTSSLVSGDTLSLDGMWFSHA